jgi:hypothetical protein
MDIHLIVIEGYMTKNVQSVKQRMIKAKRTNISSISYWMDSLGRIQYLIIFF